MTTHRKLTICIGILFLWAASLAARKIFASNQGHWNAIGQYEVDTCQETRHGMFSNPGQIVWTQGEARMCAANTRSISTYYVSINDLVYWMKSDSDTEHPCIHGTGDTVAAFSNFSLECIFSHEEQVNVHESRDLTLTAKLTPAFHRIAAPPAKPSEEWQPYQFEHFAADSSSVYFESRKIDGADPGDFSIVFPFADEKWSEFYFSRSRGKLFVNGMSMPEMDLGRFELLKFVRVPGRGVDAWFDTTNTIDPDPQTFGIDGMLGRIGNDIVYLRRDGVTVFGNMVTADTFTFTDPQHMYLFRAGQFYEVIWDADKHVASLTVVSADAINREHAEMMRRIFGTTDGS